MRAVVLLCLLHAALANPYSWDKPDPKTDYTMPTPGPNAGSACKKSDRYCGCCKMTQQTYWLRRYFTDTLNTLEDHYTEALQYLNMIKDSRVAFSVSLNSEENMRCMGPFRSNKTIDYKHAFLNLGGSYNTSTGIFTVPRSGVYVIALTVYSDAGSPGNILAACAILHVNGKVVAGPSEKNKQDQEDSVTVVLALHLKAGDKVMVTLPIGCCICDSYHHYNTFSGFLLYPTE